MGRKLPSIKLLAHFTPLNRLSDKQLVLLQAHSDVRFVKAGEEIMALGSEDKLEYFLLKGSVGLESFDGRSTTIKAGTERALSAIAALQPRQYRVVSQTDGAFLVVKQQTIQTLLADLPKENSVEFSAHSLSSGHEEQDIVEAFEADLKSNNLALPSFPDVAMRIRKLLRDPNVGADDIAEAITSDPAITVKLLKACNSALYPSTNPITTCQDAVVRLGFETTRQLVNIFAMKELFASKSPILQTHMRKLWADSREVAAIAFVLAEITPGMDPEVALLAGLLHDIGTIPVLQYIERYPEFSAQDQKVDEVVHTLKSKIGAELLHEWGFSEDLQHVVENSENWAYDSGESADYVDVVVVAQVHALIDKKQYKKLPPFEQIPAFKKLGDEGLTPEQSQTVLHEAHHRIADLRALLSGEG